MLGAGEPGAQLGGRDAVPRRHHRVIVRHVQDVLALEVALGCQPPIFHGEQRLAAEHGVELGPRPHIEFPFVTFAVGVE